MVEDPQVSVIILLHSMLPQQLQVSSGLDYYGGTTPTRETNLQGEAASGSGQRPADSHYWNLTPGPGSGTIRG